MTSQTNFFSPETILRYLKTLESKESYLYASNKKFRRLFGRDSIITSLELLHYFPDYSKNTLKALSKLQGAKGQIIHENVSKKQLETRWDSLDSTPLFLILVFEYFKKTDDFVFLKKIFPHVEKALSWISLFGDHNKDKFMEYYKNSKGLAHHCWKDSKDGIIFEDGSYPDYPVACVEVQGYLYRAYLDISEIYKLFGDLKNSSRYSLKAKELKKKFNKVFWIKENGFFALAIDGHKKPIKTISSNVGHALWSGIIDRSKIERVVQRMLKKDIFTKYGLRTLSDKMANFDPKSYHNGSIWPFDNWFFAEGLERYGYRKEADKVRRSVLLAISILKKPYECYTFEDNKLGFKITTWDGKTFSSEEIQAWTLGALYSFIMKLNRTSNKQ